MWAPCPTVFPLLKALRKVLSKDDVTVDVGSLVVESEKPEDDVDDESAGEAPDEE